MELTGDFALIPSGSLAMYEVDSEPLVDVVLDKNLGKVMQVRGRYLQLQLLMINECIILEFHLAMNYCQIIGKYCSETYAAVEFWRLAIVGWQ